MVDHSYWKKLETIDYSIAYLVCTDGSSFIECLNQEKTHYEGVMRTKVLPDIKMAEAEYADLQQLRQVFVLLLSLMTYFHFVELLLFPYGSSVKECSVIVTGTGSLHQKNIIAERTKNYLTNKTIDIVFNALIELMRSKMK